MKTYPKSIDDCINELKQCADNINYCEIEGLLTWSMAYLRDYKEKEMNNQEYIKEMFKFGKCSSCKSNLEQIEVSDPLYDFQGRQYIIHRRKCKQCKQIWAYNEYL